MRRAADLSVVLDEVLVDANAVAQRRTSEIDAVKTAAAQPRTELGKGLRALAHDLRADANDVTYGDLS